MHIFVRLPLSRKTMCIECDDHGAAPVKEICREVSRVEGIPAEFLTLAYGGRRLVETSVANGQWLTCCVSGLLGGKGGFGSMLRAIGAQIEKTTNREACRDLSGRRLRDINHEARLKRWVAKQAERENQRKQRKEYREPEHHLEDPEYERIREQIPERIQDAVTQGMSAGTKRPASTSGESSSRKRPAAALWLPDVPSDESSDGDSDSTPEDRDAPAKTESSSEQDAPSEELPSAGAETESSRDGEDSLLGKRDNVQGTECSAATTSTEIPHAEEPHPPNTDK
ncbi:splicing regulator SDE2 [Dermacentor variabilis]|uniref:splicing regulator SDE2 n=1 Tax=Dermacentor variabilis TaxID=34621 RepID=UPI003F5CB36C